MIKHFQRILATILLFTIALTLFAAYGKEGIQTLRPLTPYVRLTDSKQLRWRYGGSFKDGICPEIKPTSQCRRSRFLF